MNGKNNNFDPAKVQSLDDVREAVDSMIDATLGIMTETGGDAVKNDRGPVLLDLVNMFDDRVQALEDARDGNGGEWNGEALEASLARWIAARDRAVERYEGETGLGWARAEG